MAAYASTGAKIPRISDTLRKEFVVNNQWVQVKANMRIHSKKGKWYIVPVLIIFLFSGCAGISKTAITKTIPHEFTFPKDFLWGASTSSHQVEGNNTNNDWWEWEQTRTPSTRSGQACDQWNHFEEDFKLVQTLGHTAHRFSVEWSRIEPQEGQFDGLALDHYREVINSLKSKGIEPIVTLYHFTLPLWLAHQGGWLSEKAPELFARYAQKVTDALGGNVHYWITLNEPVVHVIRGYMSGEWPPGEKSISKTFKVFKKLLRGHVLAYEKIKETYAQKGWEVPMVGIAQSVLVFRASSRYSLMDLVTTGFCDLMFNNLFVQALIQGRACIIGFFYVHLPKAKTLDFIGLNYYTRVFVASRWFGPPEISGKAREEAAEQFRHSGKYNFLSWEIYPKGLYVFLKEFSRYKLPILVSENGIATNDDTERVAFIVEHLKATAQAMEEGAPVIGYLYWSLLDNYEWNEGFVPRFGLLGVDYTTQERTIRESARKYEEIIRSGKLNF